MRRCDWLHFPMLPRGLYRLYNSGDSHNYHPDRLWDNRDTVYLHENNNRGTGVYAHDAYHSKALEFIRENKDTTFFLYLPYPLVGVRIQIEERTKENDWLNVFEMNLDPLDKMINSEFFNQKGLVEVLQEEGPLNEKVDLAIVP